MFQGLHRYWPPLTRLIAELELDLGHPCQANAYLTPVGAQGFAVHSDTHDVFVLQTAGAKQWEVHGPRTRVTRLRRPSCSSRGTSCTCPPAPRTPRGPRTPISLHITIGINQLTWRGLVTRAISALAAKVPDEHLPAGYLEDPQALAHELGRHLHDVADELRGVDPAVAVEDEVRRFLTRRPPRLPGGLTDSRRWPTSPTRPGCDADPDTRASCSPGATSSRCCSATAPSPCPPGSGRRWTRSGPAAS